MAGEVGDGAAGQVLQNGGPAVRVGAGTALPERARLLESLRSCFARTLAWDKPRWAWCGSKAIYSIR